MFDTHVHSRFSSDGKTDMLGYLETLDDLGINGIGFAEHVDFVPGCGNYGLFDYRKYWDAINIYRKQGYTIFGGAEIDYSKDINLVIKQYLKKNPFDYTIASVHRVNGIFVSDVKDLNLLQDSGYLSLIMDKYYEEIAHSIEVDEFDVIGHIGIFKRHLSREYLNSPSLLTKLDNLENELAYKLAHSSKIVEVNTSGLFSKIGETIPGKPFLEAFYRHGGRRISLGSDAHSAKNLMGGFDKAIDCLKDIGFEYVIFPWEKNLKITI